MPSYVFDISIEIEAANERAAMHTADSIAEFVFLHDEVNAIRTSFLQEASLSDPEDA